jgi:hypothetical protein
MRRNAQLLERIEVQAAAVVALAAVYFAAAGLLRTWNPGAPLAFVPGGSWAALARTAVVVWLAAAFCAAATLRSRPSGELAAALIAAAGASLRSPRIRGLFWTQQASARAVYGWLTAEVVVMAAVLAGAVAVIALVRGLVRALRPGWLWADPLADLDDKQRKAARRDALGRRGGPKDAALAPGGAAIHLLAPPDEQAADQVPRRQRLLRAAACLAVAVAAAVVILLLLARSTQRKQILCALFVGSMGGMVLAHQVLPARLGALAAAPPLAAAAILYLLGAAAAVDEPTPVWAHLPHYARALPIDWLALGAGGSALGAWISERLHERRLLERTPQPLAQKGRPHA